MPKPSGVYAFSYTGFLQVDPAIVSRNPLIALAGMSTPANTQVAGYFPVASAGWMDFDGTGSVDKDGVVSDGWIVNSIAGGQVADNATGVVKSAIEFDGQYRLYDDYSGHIRITSKNPIVNLNNQHVTVTYYFTMAHEREELHFMVTSSSPNDRRATISGVMRRL